MVARTLTTLNMYLSLLTVIITDSIPISTNIAQRVLLNTPNPDTDKIDVLLLRIGRKRRDCRQVLSIDEIALPQFHYLSADN